MKVVAYLVNLKLLLNTYLRVELSPNFSKLIIHIMIKQAPVLYLGITITLQNDGNKDL